MNVISAINQTDDTKKHFAIIFPSEIRSQHPETVCVHLEGAHEETRMRMTINLDGKRETVFDKLFKNNSVSMCTPIEIFSPEEDEAVGTLNVFIYSTGHPAHRSTKILVKKTRSKILVQTDKAIYKPGQTVNFRLVSLNEDLQPKNILIPVVKLQDPQKNRIGQWLNVSLNQGMADFSLPLSSEPPLGEYSIQVLDTTQRFTVEEYVLPKFEVTLQFPKFIMYNSDKFSLEICARSKITRELLREKIEVCFIQETHFKTGKIPRFAFQDFGSAISSSSDKKKRGVLILIKNHCPFEQLTNYRDSEGRLLISVCKLKGRICTLVCTYAPNQGQKRFLNKVIKKLDAVKKGPIIWGGDHNLISDNKLDTSGGPRKPSETLHNQTLWQNFRRLQLVDAWRTLHANNRDYTCYNRAHNVYSRIDYIFISQSLLTEVLSCLHGPITLSDHAPVICSLAWNNTFRKQRIWSLDRKMLDKPEIKAQLATAITEYFRLNDNQETTIQSLWECHKCYIRGIAISIAARQKKQQEQLINDTLGNITKLENEHKSSLSDDVYKNLCIERQKLNDIISSERTELIRNQLKKKLNLGKSGKILADHLTDHRANNFIYKICNKDGKIKYLPEEITREFMDFYRDIYNIKASEKLPDYDTFFKTVGTHKLKQEISEEMDKPFTLEEVNAAVTQQRSGKSHGYDGFPAEYFKAFQSQLTPYILNLANDIDMQTPLSSTMNTAIIRLIPKAGKDLTHCSDYRPISLINIDVKILSTIIANRFQTFVRDIISQYQTGFIRTRGVHQNIATAVAVINHIQKHSIKAGIVALDAEKAFDRVSWTFLQKSLIHIGIGPNLLGKIMSLYKNQVARLNINDILSQPISMSNGTRQGCPLSPVLFNLHLEILFNIILNDSSIKGIPIGGNDIKYLAYADDILLTLQDPLSSLPKVLKVIKDFGSGLQCQIPTLQLLVVQAGSLLMMDGYKLGTVIIVIVFLHFFLWCSGFVDTVWTQGYSSRYTYGKPVKGNYKVSLCRKRFQWWPRRKEERNNICITIHGKLNKHGCDSKEIVAEVFKLNKTNMENTLKGSASVTEEGTGIEISTSSQTTISNVISKVSFTDADRTYKAGIPYNGVIKVVDAGDAPKAGIKVYLTSDSSVNETLVTDDSGQVAFTLNTTNWKGSKYLTAKTVLKEPAFVTGVARPEYGRSFLDLHPFYSHSTSFLKLHSLDKVLPCVGQQEVDLEYIIKSPEMNDHFDLHYLVTSAGLILEHGSLKIRSKGENEDLHGRATLKLPLNAGKTSTLQALVYLILPDGNIVADSATYKVQRCFNNKVSVKFSPDHVLPGSHLTLGVQAAPGSLCGLRVVDQSVVLMSPDKELTADKVYDLFQLSEGGGYDYRIIEPDLRCGFFHYGRPHFWQHESDADVYSLFQGIKLKILTSADIKKPVECLYPETVYRFGLPGPPGPGGPVMAEADAIVPSGGIDLSFVEEKKEKNKVRLYFPETWIWELTSVGDSGSADLHGKAPDTITDWTGGAICLGSSGFGLSSPASLRVFQPFFVDLSLPYSVVREETFLLKASVFNYLKQCIKIEVMLGPTEELEQVPCAECVYRSCLCADESKTFIWKLKAIKLGEVNITVHTEAVNTEELCQNEIIVVPKEGASDTIVKPLLVQPGGVLVEKSHSSLLCIKEGEGNKTEEVSLKIPKNILKDSERAYVTVLGDIMGTALQNLDRLLRMPYGCGEQNMVLLAPNIFILQYLEKSGQMTDAIKSKATKFLETGYQQQLKYKHNDGSYSAFGKSDPEGNTWLTAFVVKTFSKGRPYIFIDENHLNESINWLRHHQNQGGCFHSVGKLFNNAMMGGVEDGISLSAYVTIALLEAGVSMEDPMVRGAVTCLQKAALDVKNVYTQALMAYTFTLCNETQFRKDLLDKLEQKAVRQDGQVHWERDTVPSKEDLYWYRCPSAEVEMTAYVLLALLFWPKPDLTKAAEVVNWLSKQQNPYGGYSSTQDTVVALQAMAKYGELTFSDKDDVTVTVSSSSGFLAKFHVDNNNRLFLRRSSLPAITGEYTVTAAGSGCAFVQTVLRYNVPPPRSDISFLLKVTPRSNRVCEGDPVTSFELHIQAEYTGSREKSNMAVIEVNMLSGYIPVKSTVRKLETDKLIQKSEIQTDVVILYLDEVGHNPINLSIMVEQDIEVKELKSAVVKVYDYYETDEHTVAEYNHPCNRDDNSGNAR
ncbi:alpha-2-macroglobulin-like [Gastrophryne carolinensis]